MNTSDQVIETILDTCQMMLSTVQTTEARRAVWAIMRQARDLRSAERIRQMEIDNMTKAVGR